MNINSDKTGFPLKWFAITLISLVLISTTHFDLVNLARGETPKEGVSMSEHKKYSEKDLFGPTGFSFDGTVTLTIDGSNVAVPVSAVGQVNWDGKGRATSATRTFNFGGAVILKQVAEGEYQVNPDGTGTARFEVSTQEILGTPPPGVQLPSIAIETFSFVLTQPNNELQFIGTGFLDKDTGQPLAAVTVNGVLRAQR